MKNIFIIYTAIAFSFLLRGSSQAEDLILKTFLTEEYDEPVSFTVKTGSSNLVLSTADNNIAWERTEDFVTWHAVSSSKKYLVPVKKAKNAVFYRLSRCGPRPSKIYIPNDYDPKKHILLFYHYMVTPVMQRCRIDSFHSKIGLKNMILFFAHQMGERIILAIKVGLAGILIISAV